MTYLIIDVILLKEIVDSNSCTVLTLLEVSIMENSELNPLPLCITQLEPGKIYFSVRVSSSNFISLDKPFCFVGIVIRRCERGLPEKKILQEKVKGFSAPHGARECHASTRGLLVGTGEPSRFDDNYWRTFSYSPETYAFFQEIVLMQDMLKYASIVGKRLPATPAQRVQDVILNAKFAYAQAKYDHGHTD